MIVLGLTGSIGMGKSTAANMLRQLGVPVHESDAEVHALLAAGGRGVDPTRAAFPKAYDKKKNAIDRRALGEIVFADDRARLKLESILHPLVREGQEAFTRQARSNGADIAVLDIPLLFETGAETRVDFVIVVTAPFFVQKERVLARPGMDEARFHAILSKQMPDSEKQARADFVVHTGLGLARTMEELKKVLHEVRSK